MDTRQDSHVRAGDGAQRIVEALLRPPPLRDEEWEGAFTGTAGSTEGFAFHMRGRLLLGSGLVSGTGRAVDLRTPHDGVSLDGSEEAGAVRVDLWFDEPGVAARPLACDGTLSGDGTRIEGAWTVDCLNPGECDCGGGRGTFALRRVTA